MADFKISILISTKNRYGDLLLTLSKIKHLLNQNVTCVVFDDGSTDETSEKVKSDFPQVTLLRNQTSKGYIYCRNKMLNETEADFAISLDDDAHFVTENPIEIITEYFSKNPTCGLIAARIYWGKETPKNSESSELSQSVKSFVGCGHIWRMKAWRDIPNYPEWFEFYGEENYASLQLLKKKWEVCYVPKLLVQHRVDLKTELKRIKILLFVTEDLYELIGTIILCFRQSVQFKKMAYSIWMQCKTKFLKGFQSNKTIAFSHFDLFVAAPKLIKFRNALTIEEYKAYGELNEAKIYWNP